MSNIFKILEKYRRLFIATVFIILCLALAFVIYKVFFSSQPLPVPIQTQNISSSSVNGLPQAQTGKGNVVNQGQPTPLKPSTDILTKKQKPSEIARGGLTKVKELNNDQGLGAVLAPNGQDIQFYNKDLGQFYRLNNDGTAVPLSDKVFYNVKKVTWSPKKNKAILEYPDGANIIYDFDNNKQITLPKHWEDFNFSPQGDKIIAKSIGLDANNRWLLVANNDGTNAKPLKPLGTNADNVITDWSPNNQIIAMFSEGVDFTRKEVYFIGLNDENFKSTIVEGRGFMPLWSPKGDYLLYSVYSPQTDSRPNLWVVNALGERIGTGRRSLDVQTWANKCAFTSNTELYCAVPENLEKGAGIFSSLAKSTKDDLIKIDTKTGLKKIIAVPDGTYNMSDLIVSKDGSTLFFTDAVSGKINSIKLK